MARALAIYNITDAALEEGQGVIDLQVYSGLRDFVVATLINFKTLEKNTLNRKELNFGLSNYKSSASPGRELKPLSTANSMISLRVKELEALGCLTIKKEQLLVDGRKRSCNIHRINSLSKLERHLLENRSKSPAPQGRPSRAKLIVYSDALEEKGMTKLNAEGDVTPYSERAFSILESVARSRSDKRTVINCKYYIQKNDFVEITSTTSTAKGSGIMYSSDQRIIQALNGMLKQANDDCQGSLFGHAIPAKIIGEYCYFDLYALTKEIGLQSNTIKNRTNVRKMLERLKDTSFSVDASNSNYWRKHYMPDVGFTKADYRYITEFYSAEDWYLKIGKQGEEIELLEDRYFVVKFHPLIFSAMTTPQMAFINHDGLKRERLDLAHRLNNWVKPTIGVRDRGHGNDHHKYTLDIFQQRVRPSSAMQHFETQFYRLAERQDDLEVENPHSESVRLAKGETPEGVFWLNGYYFKIEFNKEEAEKIYRKTRTVRKKRRKDYPVITVWRDREDNVVGDNSKHNKALARQFKSLVSPQEGRGTVDDGTVNIFELYADELETE